MSRPCETLYARNTWHFNRLHRNKLSEKTNYTLSLRTSWRKNGKKSRCEMQTSRKFVCDHAAYGTGLTNKMVLCEAGAFGYQARYETARKCVLILPDYTGRGRTVLII